MMKQMKWMQYAGAALLALLMLAWALPALGEAQSGDSWSSINQEIARPDGWQRFVTDSPFALGEKQPCAQLPGYFERAWGAYPSLDGSTVCVPLAMELARQHLSMAEEDLSGFVAFSTTPYAYERLIHKKPNPTVTVMSEKTTMDGAHPVDLFLGTEPSDEELQMAADAGVELVAVPICYDAFVFIVNTENPVNALTVEQIQRIYTGETTMWSEVGGEAETRIIPYQRPKNSGSQTTMEKRVMQGKPLKEITYISDTMAGLVVLVSEVDEGRYGLGEGHSIGYSFLYYINTLYRSERIKTLAVDGFAPSPENIRSGAYPFTTCYYAVYRKGDANAAAFADWLTGEAGQKVVAQAGYIPIRE